MPLFPLLFATQQKRFVGTVPLIAAAIAIISARTVFFDLHDREP
jgi:hypothetical protein